MYCPTNWSSNWVISNRVSAYVTGLWSAQYHIDGKLLKRVETALAKSCSYRDLLSTHNLVDSYLVPDAEAIEDAVIGVLNMIYPRSGGTKKGHSKDALPKKRVNAVGKASSLKASEGKWSWWSCKQCWSYDQFSSNKIQTSIDRGSTRTSGPLH